MKKLFLLSLVFALLLCNGCGKQNTTELQISAAASLTDVMKELAAVYQKEQPTVKFTFNFGSSGALQQAIENGGYADIFLSAAQKQMNALDKAGMLEPGTRRDLLVNSLVLIVPGNGSKNLSSFSDLARPDIRLIAIGGKGVPVGQYTREVFDKLSLTEAVTGRLVLGTDVRQVLAWVGQGEADCGIVYATDAAISKDVKITATAPAGSHRPIIYPAAVLKGSKHKQTAMDFLTFLGSEKAAKIFVKYGFKVK